MTMDYKEAQKAVSAKKPKENYLIIKVAYDNRLVLPHKEGMAFMAALVHAEQLTDSYDREKPRRIIALDQSTITTHVMSAEEYEHHKIAALMGMKVEDIKSMVDKINYPKPPEPGTT